MAGSRRRARGANAPSIDDDSMPSLDGGWIKGVHYDVDLHREESAEDESVIAQPGPNDKGIAKPVSLVPSRSRKDVDIQHNRQPVSDTENLPDAANASSSAAGPTPGSEPQTDTPHGHDSPDTDLDQDTVESQSDDSLNTNLLIQNEIDALSKTEGGNTSSLASSADMELSEDSHIEAAVRQIVGSLKQSYEDDKKRFQNKLQLAFRQRLSKMEEKATRLLRKKLHNARKKDKLLVAEKEARLNDLLVRLGELAAEVDRQRAEIRKASKAFEQKMLENDIVNNELHDLGRNLSHQAESLGNALVDEKPETRHSSRVDRSGSSNRDSTTPRLNPRGS